MPKKDSIKEKSISAFRLFLLLYCQKLAGTFTADVALTISVAKDRVDRSEDIPYHL
jgi:hypothetical protein